jgi:hypothetical protein
MEQDKEDAAAAREAELSEVLSAYAETPPVSYGFVLGFVLLGLLVCTLLAWFATRAPHSAPLHFEPEVGATFQRGVQAFRAGEWADALRMMRQARAELDGRVARVEDYIVRLELIEHDEQHLVQAVRALARGDAQAALLLAARIAPNSPLFAQAESLSRKARAQLAQEAATEPAAAPPEVPEKQPGGHRSATRRPPETPHGVGHAWRRDQGAW